MSPLVAPSGLAGLDLDGMERLLTGRRIGLAFSIDEDAFVLAGQTSAADLPDQLRLLATKLAHPRWDPALLARFRSSALDGYDLQFASASARAGRELGARDPARRPALAAGRAGRHRGGDGRDVPARLCAACSPQGPVHAIIVGDIDLEAAVAAMRAHRRRAAAPRRARPREPIAPRPPAPNPEPVRFTHRGDPNQAYALIGWTTLGGRDRTRERRALSLAGNILQARLFDRLREEEGATYSPNAAYLGAESFPDWGIFFATAEIRPERAETFFRVAREIVADLAARPASAEEFARAQNPVISGIERRLATNGYWLQALENWESDERDIENVRTYLADYRALTAEDVRRAVATWVTDQGDWSMLVLPARGAAPRDANNGRRHRLDRRARGAARAPAADRLEPVPAARPALLRGQEPRLLDPAVGRLGAAISCSARCPASPIDVGWSYVVHTAAADRDRLFDHPADGRGLSPADPDAGDLHLGRLDPDRRSSPPPPSRRSRRGASRPSSSPGMRPEGIRFLGAILLTVSLLLAWSALYYGINFYILLEEQIDRLLRLESQASNAQLAMLRYQLNPHFLFNTLNSISTLVLLKQTDRANAMLSRLSSFLRYTLVNEPTAHGDGRAGGRDAEALSRDREDALRGPAARRISRSIRAATRRAAAVAAAPAADRECDQICGDAAGGGRRHLDRGRAARPTGCIDQRRRHRAGRGCAIYDARPSNRPASVWRTFGTVWRRPMATISGSRHSRTRQGASAFSSKSHIKSKPRSVE